MIKRLTAHGNSAALIIDKPILARSSVLSTTRARGPREVGATGES
jgi:hypothetical protein